MTVLTRQPEIPFPAMDASVRAPLVLGRHDLHSLTELVSGIVEKRAPRWWWGAIFVTGTLMLGCFVAIGYLFVTGVGVWGENQPVSWAWDITNFVFWIGIGHAGTLISAILFLLRQKWRTSINRSAEAMTLFAVACAGIFPAIHVGRWWRILFMAPIPNSNAIWPNFRSPLLWDMFAVSAYAMVSVLFWYVGMIPDLATLRDRATTKTRQFIYGLLALGWRGSNRHWRHYEMAYLILAGLATPLVLSVHTVVSFDFAVSIIPGWHGTIFPPYFVAGAIFSGFAMVLTLLIPARALLGLQDLITTRHLENMCKVILATGSMVAYAYAMELCMAWYSGNAYELFVFENRASGPYWWAFWTMILCNVVVPQLFWFKKLRTTAWMIFILAILVNVGMWFERFVIIVTSLHRDFLPSSWGYYSPTWVEVLTFAGSIGLFATLFLLFIRFLPMIAMAEVKGVVHTQGPGFGVQGSGFRRRQMTQSPAVQAVVYGAMGEFDSAEALLAAARAVRAAGYTWFDVNSPYAIHGMDQAMGLGLSKLGWFALVGGVVGALCGMGLQWYANSQAYPLITGAKPYFSWQAFIPITFEVMVLFAAFGAVMGMLWLNGLPRWYHATLKSDRFAKASDDGFFLVIEAADAKFEAIAVRQFLQMIGGREIAVLED